MTISDTAIAQVLDAIEHIVSDATETPEAKGERFLAMATEGQAAALEEFASWFVDDEGATADEPETPPAT